MGDVYRVTIERESGSGEDFESETIFQVAGGIGLVVKVAPGALMDALRAAHEEGVPDAGNAAERVMDAAAAAGAPVHPFGGEERPRRKRRTKAEIAADEEAARRAAPGAQSSAPEPAPAPVDVPAPLALVPPAGEAPAAVAPPYNPFEVK